jgi:hypothetical protein
MSSEVGSGQVAIFPTFKGFRQNVARETDGAAKDAGSRFSRGFSKSGTDAGQSAGKGFRAAFGTASSGAATATLKQINAEVVSSSKALSTARLKEQDDAGKVRIAEAQLAEARKKGGADSARVVAAEEKLASAQRNLVSTQTSVKSSTDRLATARKQLAAASEDASDKEEKSSKGFGARIKAAFTRDLAAAGDSGGKESGRRAGEGLRTGILGAVGSLAAPLAAAVAGLGIGRMLVSSITNASDFQESATAITAVFGDADRTIQDFAKNSATSLGQSKNQTLDAARVFGVFGKAAGLSGGELAGFSTDFITLAADLASFNNTSPEEAIEALGAGLRGESEPLRAYGILLDDATLKARATKMGIYSGNDALTQQQKVLASQAEIMAQTSTQQGDFARTSQGLANQQRILKAQTENLSTSFGMLFLPIVLKVVGALNNTLVPALFAGVDAVTAVYDGFREGKTALDLGDKTAGLVAFGGTLRGFADQVGVIFGGVKASIASAFSGDGSQLSTLIGQVIGFVSALSPLQLVFSAIAPLLPTLLSLSSQVAGALTVLLGAALQALTPLLQNIVEDLVGLAGFMGRNTELVGAFASAILGGIIALKLYKGVVLAISAATKIWALAQAAFNLIASANPIAILVIAIGALVAGIVYLATQTTFFQDLWSNVASFFSTLWQATQVVFEAVLGAIVSFLTGQLLFIQSTWNAIWTGISSFFTGLWNGLVAFVQTVLVALATVILIQVTAVQTIWNTVWQAIGDFLSGIWNAIVTTVTTNFQNMVALAQERLAALAAGWNAVWSAVLGFLSAVWNGIVSVVTTVFGAVQGFILGALATIHGTWMSIWGAISSFFAGIWNGILSYVQGVAAGVIGAVAGIVNSVRSKVGEAVSFVAGLPGQAMSALGDLGSKLVSSGRALIQGFIDGIKGMIGNVGRAVSNVVQGALDFFPNSPAKKGPLMGPGWRKLRRSGQAVTDQFSDGFDPDVFDFRGGFPGDPGPSSGGGDGGGAGGGGGMQVIFNGPVTTQDVPELIKAQRREATRARKAALGGARRVRVAA